MNQTAQTQLDLRQTKDSVVAQTSEISRLSGPSKTQGLGSQNTLRHDTYQPPLAAITYGSESKSPEWTEKKETSVVSASCRKHPVVSAWRSHDECVLRSQCLKVATKLFAPPFSPLLSSWTTVSKLRNHEHLPTCTNMTQASSIYQSLKSIP